jgi:histidyl-tRNA synthetase
MSYKASIPKGTRDFSPAEMLKRKYVFSVMEAAFQKFGFSAIETPSMENLDTLTGKYGEEGDRLIFKILNSGDFLSKTNIKSDSTSKEVVSEISDKALRYDLTVPFARYVVQNRNDITFPFKRYQIQPVWRADRPQKGRFREFFQCDADLIGTDSLLAEVELIQLYDEVFSTLGLSDFSIQFNNRKILSGIAEVIGESEKLIDITVCLDKLDKIGVEKVKSEMLAKGISDNAISQLDPLFGLTGSNQDKLTILKSFLSKSEIGVKGIHEIEFVLNSINDIGLNKAKIVIDVNLARGLNYYTGAIMEIKTHEYEIGSLGGGGRYDDLTGIFGLKNVSGVGISFGFDRTFMVMDALNLFPELSVSNTRVMFVNFGEEESKYCLKLLRDLRSLGVSSELYPSSVKMKKQMQYANQKDVEFTVLVGEEEMNSGLLTIKNMLDGTQQKVNFEGLVSLLKN